MCQPKCQFENTNIKILTMILYAEPFNRLIAISGACQHFVFSAGTVTALSAVFAMSVQDSQGNSLVLAQ